MNIRRSILFLGTLLLLAGCAKQQLETSYYLLEFTPSTGNQKLTVSEPLPYRVQVINFKIPRSYDSIRIISRFSSHQINYYRYSLWAVRPQIAVADMVVQQINAYRLFKACQREFLEERPDYEITGEIQQIERFDSEQYTAAHLKMEFQFYDYDKKDVLVHHYCDREVNIPPGNMTIFAKAISDIVQNESEAFLVKIVEYFQTQQADSLKAQE